MYKRLIAYHRLSVSHCESEVDNHGRDFDKEREACDESRRVFV